MFKAIISTIFLLANITCNVFCFGQNVAKKVSKSKPFILGQTEEIFAQELNENRVLNVYLPEGYNANDTVHYPVIYLLDGSADEDFIHVAGLVQFNNFSWINRVPKSIVVGIANIDRKRDFTFPSSVDAERVKYPTTGHADNFIAFIEKDLQPFIAQHYKVNKHKTLIGQSLGGLLASQILFEKPYLFDQYIIISPSLWWSNGALLARQPKTAESNFSQKIKVYVGVGKEGLAPGTANRVMEVDANLLVEKLKEANNKDLKVYFDYLPQEDHATIGHQAIFNAFKMLYPAEEK